jgi:hypothetical protein
VENSAAFGKRYDVVGEDCMAAMGEGRRRGGFSSAFLADESYGVIGEDDGARVQAGDAAQAEQQSEDRAEEIGTRVCER